MDLAEDLAGGSGLSVQPLGDWWPEYPQSPLEATTDYFNGAALDPKWTVWDVLATQSETVADNWLILNKASTAGVDWSGVHQALPAGSLTFTVFCALQASMAAAAGPAFAGIMVAEDLIANPATADFKALLIGTNNTPDLFVQQRSMTGQTNLGVNVAFHSGNLSEFWLRFRYNSATNAGFWDFCGGRRASGWINLVNNTGLVFTPARIGLCVLNQSGVPGRAYFRSFIQSVAGDAFSFDRRPGQAVQLAEIP